MSSAHHRRGIPLTGRPGVVVDRYPTCGSARIRRNTQREREIVYLRSQGKKLREIGERHGISNARVSQIIKRVKHEKGGDKNAQTDPTGG